MLLKIGRLKRNDRIIGLSTCSSIQINLCRFPVAWRAKSPNGGDSGDRDRVTDKAVIGEAESPC